MGPRQLPPPSCTPFPSEEHTSIHLRNQASSPTGRPIKEKCSDTINKPHWVEASGRKTVNTPGSTAFLRKGLLTKLAGVWELGLGEGSHR